MGQTGRAPMASMRVKTHRNRRAAYLVTIPQAGTKAFLVQDSACVIGLRQSTYHRKYLARVCLLPARQQPLAETPNRSCHILCTLRPCRSGRPHPVPKTQRYTRKKHSRDHHPTSLHLAPPRTLCMAVYITICAGEHQTIELSAPSLRCYTYTRACSIVSVVARTHTKGHIARPKPHLGTRLLSHTHGGLSLLLGHG